MILINGIIFLCFIFSINAICWPDYIKCWQNRFKVIRYLKKYDYIAAEQLASPASSKYLKAAIKRFQDLVGLEPTGEIDFETLTIVGKPTCGRGDTYSTRIHDVIPWKNEVITYSVVANTRRFCYADLKRTMRDVFNAWSEHIPRQFVEVNTETAADIKIRFGRWTHGDGMDFDGKGGTYAHANATGILHFDDDDIFKIYKPGEAIKDVTLLDIFWVALHEAGHVLGVDHIKGGPSIMERIYIASRDLLGNYVVPTLTGPDIEKIQEIYGGKTRPKIDTTTTIANGASYTAYAVVETDQEYLGNITAEFFQAAQQSKWNMPEIPRNTPFTEIVPGAFKAFNPEATNNDMVYVTVFLHDIATGYIKKIVDVHEITPNSGVMIAADTQLKNALTGKIWVDETGIDHTRRKCCFYG